MCYVFLLHNKKDLETKRSDYKGGEGDAKND